MVVLSDASELNELYLCALCVYREARGEPYEGKFGVACVIRNRTKDAGARWPTTYRGVVLQPKQFSCFNPNDSQSKVWPFSGPDKVWAECVRAAFSVQHTDADNVGGANHYHTLSINPHWADPNKLTAIIGNHKFYQL